MCGICGTVPFDGGVDRRRIEQAVAVLRHRGPDGSGVWVESASTNPIMLGATRLAVLDPTSAGHQPMHDPSGRYHLVYNGELYNYRALRDELAQTGFRFCTSGDTEVVLAACTHWGVDACRRFNGMWALAFHDSRTGEGFLSRDRYGIKPLVYATTCDGLSFASEIGALTYLCDVGSKIDDEALIDLLQFGYIAHPHTIYSGARRLPPGHSLKFDRKGVGELARYEPPPSAVNGRADVTYDDACAQSRQLLADAVVARRVSDVPIGAFLSGGLDSSIITAHLAKAIGQPIETFSIGFADQQNYDETAYATLVAKHFGTNHHTLRLTNDEILAAIPNVLDHLSEPVGDSSIIPTSILSGFARQFVTVALSGDGGDELFGGYWRYLGHDAWRIYQRVPRFLRRYLLEPALSGMSVSKTNSLGNRLRQFRKVLRARSGDALARHVSWSRILSPEAEGILVDRELSAQHEAKVVELAKCLTEGCSSGDDLNRILMFDLQHQLPSDMLHKVDQASMMHSLEVRVPFLDPAVVRMATSLPADFKIRRGRRKRLLTDAYRGVVPDVILDRAKKGFEVPMGELLRGPLREMFFDTVTRSTVESFGLLSYEKVCEVYDTHAARRDEHADLLFALLSLCWWRGSGRNEKAPRPR